jgi:hypothetical protein
MGAVPGHLQRPQALSGTRALPLLIGLVLLSQACSPGSEGGGIGPIRDLADLLQDGPNRKWITIAEFGGRFSAGPNFGGQGLQCGDGACDSQETDAFRFPVETVPIRMVCSGDVSEVRVHAVYVERQGPYVEELGPRLACPVYETGYGHTGISLARPRELVAFTVWSLIFTWRSGSYVTKGKFAAAVQLWNGPWREPLCGKPGSGSPAGWLQCISPTISEERLSSANPERVPIDA